MVGVAVQQRDAKAAIAGVDKEWPEAEGRRFSEVFVGVAEATVDLKWDVEVAAFQRRLEEQGVAQGAA